MLILKDRKAVLLKLKDPNRVTTVIPKAKVVEANGSRYVAVKHGPEEVQVLRNLGINAPSPIKYHYAWPRRRGINPFAAQHETAEFLTLNNRAFILNGMGSGKTLATLWGYDYLRSLGIVKKALVITPLSTLERTWNDEVFQHFPHLTTAVLHGDRARRLKLLAEDVDLYLVNHDGIKVSGFVEALAARSDIDLIVVDEIAQVARNSGTARYKALNTIVNRQTPRRAWGLTGTPVPNAPTDAWAQCRLLVPERVPPYFNRFKEQVMRQISQFLWVPRPNAMDVVYEAMQPAVRFSLDDCIDLPPCIHQMREVELSAEQKKAYKEMLVKLKTEAEAGEVLAVNEAVKAQKLVQIACGVAYGTNGEEVLFDAGHRMQVVKEIVEEAGTKVIVFVPFVAVIGALRDYLEAELTPADYTRRKLGGTAGTLVEVIHGGVSKNERDRIFQAFQQSPEPKVIIAQPAAMSHGLTLTAASTIVWYAPITSNDTFDQANARIVRPGQKHSQLVVMIEGTDIERRYYQRLKEKQKVQGVLLDMVRGTRLALDMVQS